MPILWGFPETVLGPIGSSMHCSVAQKWTAAEAGGLTVAQAVAARGQAGGRGSPPGPPCLLLPGSQGHRAKPARATTQAQLARAGPASKTLPSGAPQPPTPLSNVTRRRAYIYMCVCQTIKLPIWDKHFVFLKTIIGQQILI